MAKRNKYRSSKASDFFDYREGKLSEQERNAIERRMQKDSFDSDAAEGFSKVSREEAEQDLQSAAARIRMRVEGETSRNSVGRNSSQPPDNYSQPDGNLKTGGEWWISGNRKIAQSRRIGRSRRIAWYSAAAAIASLMIVTTIFFRLNDNGLERFETAPEMREAAREQSVKSKSVPPEEAEMDQVKPVDEEAMDQVMPVEQEEMVQDGSVRDGSVRDGSVRDGSVQDRSVRDGSVRDDAAFPVTAGPDAKKGYDLKEMQMHQQQNNLDREAQALAKELPAVTAEEPQEVEEDHAFAWEKMDEAAAAGRYRPAEKRMAAAETPSESKTTFAPQPKPEAAAEPKNAKDLQAPLAAKDPVMQEQKVADISYQLTGTVSGIVRSADDLEPLPGAIVRLKNSETGTVADLKGRFTFDATAAQEETLEVSYPGMITEEVPVKTEHMEIVLLPDESSLDEVVVISHTTSKNSQLTASTTAQEIEPSGTVKFESAVPANGPAGFRSYIDSALVYPELTETSGKEVVVLKFTVSPNGRPQNFRVVRAPDDEAFEKEAIRVVSEGPAWQPATKNGQYTEEEVRLRIVFRKE